MNEKIEYAEITYSSNKRIRIENEGKCLAQLVIGT